MSVKVYAGGKLAYDSRLPVERGYTMQAIQIREKINTAGSAKLILPAQHPMRESFPAFKTLVEIYRGNTLRWRGRSLPETRDFHCRGTITCEGELCFLQDAILRPGTYSGELAEVFAQYINAYNAAVEPWKRFAVGNITVTADAQVEILKKSAEKIYKAVMSLVSSYGGYILFDSAPDGSRRINWYKDMPYSCNQRISLGYNLTDYSSSVDVSGFATRIIPYGAKGEDGNPITIDVDGKDYVESAEGIAQRGIIEATVTYSHITDPEDLRIAAQKDVDRAATLPEIIKLSALDMSTQNTSVEAFRIGQRVLSESDPHKLSGYYDLIAMEEDLVNPGAGGITLTREAAYLDVGSSATLTGAISGTGMEKQFASFLTVAAGLTSAILGANGGGVRLLDTNGDDMPDELYVADNPDIEKAVNVWRLNYMGLAASSDGYNGPYELGMALGVGILADFIKAGTLDAALVKVVNLIVDHLVSVLGTSTLEIDGAMLRMLSESNETVRLTNQFAGLPILYMDDYSDGVRKHRGEYSPHHIRLGGSAVTGQLEIGVDQTTGAAYIRIGETELIKKISWKSNGDGTYTLIGS